MAVFDHILFPTDFSCQCELARPFVRSMAQKCSSTITLLHVIQAAARAYGMEDFYPPLDVEGMKDKLYEKLTRFIEPPEGAIGAFVEIGEPPEWIAEHARRGNFDLIMMPTHGRGKFRHFLFGSTTAKILHELPCPVWTCARLEDPASASHVECRSLLCALDLEPGSLELLHHSVELAGTLKAALHLVHAIPYAQAWIDPPFSEQYCGALLEAASDRIAELQRQAGTDLEVWVEALPVAELVRRAALHYNADLVIIGRGKLHQRFGGLRTNAYGIIGSSPCPVLSF
jgi:nucleotide-binding universal stress UspA family protein